MQRLRQTYNTSIIFIDDLYIVIKGKRIFVWLCCIRRLIDGYGYMWTSRRFIVTLPTVFLILSDIVRKHSCALNLHLVLFRSIFCVCVLCVLCYSVFANVSMLIDDVSILFSKITLSGPLIFCRYVCCLFQLSHCWCKWIRKQMEPFRVIKNSVF